MEQLEKGNALERAVESIEAAILASSPNLANSAFRVEGKKILSVAGVRHEIDLYVTATLADQYGVVFIFECKNWEAERVGKNDIIIFSEKIRVANAQRGFFVAKSYSKDAIAQAELDARVKLLTAETLDPTAVMVPCGFHGIATDNFNVHVRFTGEDEDSTTERQCDLKELTLKLGGQTTDIREFVNGLMKKFSDAAVNEFPSGSVEAGVHLVKFSGKHVFEPGFALLNERPTKSIDMDGTVDVRVAKGVVVSAFDVAGRGRGVTVQVLMPPLHVQAEFGLIPTDRE